MKVAIKEIMERVGHANYETTMLYTHSQGISQNQTVKAFDILLIGIILDLKH